MQDPERASKDQQRPPAPIGTPPKRQLAITRDEAEAAKYPDHRDVIDEILTTTRKQIEKEGGRIKEVLKPNGSGETKFVLADRTVLITIKSTKKGVIREIEITTTKDDGNTRELSNEMEPYQASFHERGLDNKRRTFWPAKWKHSLPTRAIYDPIGPELKIIFTSDPKTNIPKGWIATGNLNFADTGGLGQLRVSLATIFGENKKIQWPSKIDFNGHSAYVTVVASGSPDF